MLKKTTEQATVKDKNLVIKELFQYHQPFIPCPKSTSLPHQVPQIGNDCSLMGAFWPLITAPALLLTSWIKSFSSEKMLWWPILILAGCRRSISDVSDSLSHWWLADFTDVTLVSEDTNWRLYWCCSGKWGNSYPARKSYPVKKVISWEKVILWEKVISWEKVVLWEKVI